MYMYVYAYIVCLTTLNPAMHTCMHCICTAYVLYMYCMYCIYCMCIYVYVYVYVYMYTAYVLYMHCMYCIYCICIHYCITFNFSVTVSPSLPNTVLQYIVCYSFTSHCLLYTFGLFSVRCMINLVHVYAEGKARQNPKADSEKKLSCLGRDSCMSVCLSCVIVKIMFSCCPGFGLCMYMRKCRCVCVCVCVIMSTLCII